MDDPRTGTRVRLGEVGRELACAMAEAGHARAAIETLARPRLGVWFEKRF